MSVPLAFLPRLLDSASNSTTAKVTEVNPNQAGPYQTSGSRTTTVSTILSCQVWAFLSQIAEIKP